MLLHMNVYTNHPRNRSSELFIFNYGYTIGFSCVVPISLHKRTIQDISKDTYLDKKYSCKR
ncbi:hypothetical protein, partial [Lachnotalea glycerini]|uniref:hypothetical protein n=1 Tax=Lachnotalea glycerini TaxID=1763509 RepID=UPI001A9A42D6